MCSFSKTAPSKSLIIFKTFMVKCTVFDLLSSLWLTVLHGPVLVPTREIWRSLCTIACFLFLFFFHGKKNLGMFGIQRIPEQPLFIPSYVILCNCIQCCVCCCTHMCCSCPCYCCCCVWLCRCASGWVSCAGCVHFVRRRSRALRAAYGRIVECSGPPACSYTPVKLRS